MSPAEIAALAGTFLGGAIAGAALIIKLKGKAPPGGDRLRGGPVKK